MNVLIGPDKRILNQVFCILRVACLMVQKMEQPSPIALRQFRKRRLAALLYLVG